MSTVMVSEKPWLRKPEEVRLKRQVKAFDLDKIIGNPECPNFEETVRAFASDRKHSREEQKRFVRALSSNYFYENQSRLQPHIDFKSMVRYARRAFWMLVALEEYKAAARVATMVFDILQKIKRSIYITEYTPEERKRELLNFQRFLVAARDGVTLFLFERYKRDDAGYGFWTGQAMKGFLSCVMDSSPEVRDAILAWLMEDFKKKVHNYSGNPHIEYGDWIKVRLALVVLLGSNKIEMSKAVLRGLGELLSVLRSIEYHHREFSHERRDTFVVQTKMNEYLVGVQAVLDSANMWLCGRLLFDAKEGLALKGWFYR